MNHIVYSTETGLIVGGPIPNQADADRIASNKPNQAVLAVTEKVIERAERRVDAFLEELRDWTEAESLAQYKIDSYLFVDTEAVRRQGLAEANPSAGVDLDENGRVRNNRRRNNKAKRQVNDITSADDHLFDHLDLIQDTADLIMDDIEVAASQTAVDDIVEAMPTDVRWPAWTAI